MNPHRELIQRAQQILMTTPAEFICIAISRAAHEHPFLRHAAKTLTSRIEAGLDGESTLDGWCEDQGLRLTHDRLLLARLAWLDKLLEDYP